jgi:anion transporter
MTQAGTRAVASLRAGPIISALIVVLAIVVYALPPPAGVSRTVMHAAGLVTFVIGFWATQRLPEHLTGLLFLLLVVLTETAPAAVAFSGFVSGTLWLVLGGLIIAEAVRVTALGERCAARLLGVFMHSYPLLVTAVVVVSTLLCFVMPATVARILLLVPIVAGLAAQVGLERGSRGYEGLMLAALVATFQIGTGVLPANAPNLALAGAAEALHGVHIKYGEYLWVQFPVLGLAKMVLIIAITCWMFPARISACSTAVGGDPPSAAERRLAIVLITALALWATDHIHNVRPGWIALAAGLVVVLPRIGVMPVSAFNDNIKFGPFFYIGAVLGLGAVVAHSGLSTALGAAVLPLLPLERGADFGNFIWLALASTIACLITTNPAQPGLMVPIAPQIAEATGWPIMSALMTSALGFSNIVLPYTIPPLVVGMQLAGIRFRTAARYTLAIAVPSVIILLPLDFLWWRTIGYFAQSGG